MSVTQRFPYKDFILNQSVPKKGVPWKVSAIEDVRCREVSLYYAETKEIIYKSVDLKGVVYNYESHRVNGP